MYFVGQCLIFHLRRGKSVMFIYLIVVALCNSLKGYVTQNCHAFIIRT